jgi:chromate transport protein ChrA
LLKCFEILVPYKRTHHGLAMNREFLRKAVLALGVVFAYFAWQLAIPGMWWLLLAGLTIWFVYDLSVGATLWRKRRQK